MVAGDAGNSYREGAHRSGAVRRLTAQPSALIIKKGKKEEGLKTTQNNFENR
jgi:hypothetical protein